MLTINVSFQVGEELPYLKQDEVAELHNLLFASYYLRYKMFHTPFNSFDLTKLPVASSSVLSSEFTKSFSESQVFMFLYLRVRTEDQFLFAVCTNFYWISFTFFWLSCLIACCFYFFYISIYFSDISEYARVIFKSSFPCVFSYFCFLVGICGEASAPNKLALEVVDSQRNYISDE